MEKKSLYAIILCIALALVSVAGNVWLWSSLNNADREISNLETTIEAKDSAIGDLQEQVGRLQSEKETLQTQVSGLESVKETLEAQISRLKSEVSDLNSEISGLRTELQKKERRISELEAVNLNGVATLSWISSSFTFEGTVSNYGVETAYGVYATLSLYYKGDKVYEEEVYVGDLAGREMDTFEWSFTFYGSWDKWDWTVTQH